MEWNEFQFLHRKPSGIDRVDTVVSGPQKAFTLAEVLITLAIIGVVAALTIPTVVKNYKERQTITQLKKAYSTLSQAYNQSVAQNGPIDTWQLKPNDSPEPINKYFLPYLKVSKNCGNGSGCWFSGLPKRLKGNNTSSWFSAIPYDTHGLVTKYILADGTALAFTNSGECIYPNTNPKINNRCGTVQVDLNGKKEPNRFGVDIFAFHLTKYGVIPMGVKDDSCADIENCSTENSKSGFSCTAWAIAHDSMDYLRHEVSW